MSEYITTALRDNRTTRSDLSDSSKHIHWLSPRSPQQPSITGLQVPACTSSWPLPEDLVPGTAETSVTYHFTWLCAMTYNMQPCQLCKQRQLHYSSKKSFNVWRFSAWPGGLPRRRVRRVRDHKAERAIVGWETIEVGGGSSNLIFIFTMFYPQSAYFRVDF